MDISYHISIAIRNYLRENGMRSYKLAEASGCNKTSLNDWLYQRRLPSTRSLIRLADYMNVSLDYLVGRREKSSLIRSAVSEKFGRRISSMQADEVTSYRIAKHCKVGTSAVSKWRDVKRLPSLETLISLADGFGCSMDYIVGRTNIPD